jgi:hypothetical protein
MTAANEAPVSEFTALQLRLTDLQRSIDVGNAETRGQLALLVQKSEQAATTHAEFRASVEKEFERHAHALAVEETERVRADGELARKVDALRLRGAMVVGGASVLGAGVGSVVTVLLSHR